MVEIYPDYKVIFYSNSKCASSTLKIAFRSILGLPLPASPRKPIPYYIENYKDYGIFTFVRNPFDRVVSFYHWNNKVSVRTRGYKLHSSFEHYINEEYVLQPIRRADNDIQLKQCFRDSKISDLNQIFFVGKVERLQDDYHALCELLKVYPVSLVHEKKSLDRTKDYREYYNTETREIIENVYKNDFLMFGYKF